MYVLVVVMVTFVMGLQSIAGMLSPVNDLDCDGNWLLYTEGKLFMKTIDVFFCLLFFPFSPCVLAHSAILCKYQLWSM